MVDVSKFVIVPNQIIVAPALTIYGGTEKTLALNKALMDSMGHPLYVQVLMYDRYLAIRPAAQSDPNVFKIRSNKQVNGRAISRAMNLSNTRSLKIPVHRNGDLYVGEIPSE